MAALLTRLPDRSCLGIMPTRDDQTLADTNASLSDAEVARYHADGFIVPDWRLPLHDVERLRRLLDQLIDESPKVRPEHLVLRWGGGDAALAVHAAILEFARSPAVLNIVERLLGPDLMCWGAHMFCKPAGDGRVVPWHQDGDYWPIRPLATCTVWVALDHSGPENGCLRVVPGSHKKRETLAHEQVEREDWALNQTLVSGTFDPNDAVDVVLEPGQMSIHDVFMIHGSEANRSTQRRAGLAIRYMPATSLYDRAIKMPGGAAAIRQDMSQRPIYLVRGEDRAGNDFTIGQDRPFAVGGD